MSSRGSYLEGLIFGILRYVGERSQKLVGGNSHKRLGETEKIYNVERGVFEKYNHPQERYLKNYKEKDRQRSRIPRLLSEEAREGDCLDVFSTPTTIEDNKMTELTS